MSEELERLEEARLRAAAEYREARRRGDWREIEAAGARADELARRVEELRRKTDPPEP